MKPSGKSVTRFISHTGMSKYRIFSLQPIPTLCDWRCSCPLPLVRSCSGNEAPDYCRSFIIISQCVLHTKWESGRSVLGIMQIIIPASISYQDPLWYMMFPEATDELHFDHITCGRFALSPKIPLPWPDQN